MICLLQRVSEASVRVDDEIIGQIAGGLLVLMAVQPDDDVAVAQRYLDRLLNYRIFSDSDGKMNLSLVDVHGGLLLVPQFTLAADTRRGRRPSFSGGASPEHGNNIFDLMVKLAKTQYPDVEAGRFGADMKVHLINDGPVTFILE